MSVSGSVNAPLHCVNGDGLFDRQIGFTILSRQWKFDRDRDRDRNGDGTYKQTFKNITLVALLGFSVR